MRPIDGDALFDKVYEAFGDDIDGGMANLFMEWINEAPTLTPPNEPLTCEGCLYAPDLPYEVHCRGCARLYTDHYRRPLAGEEDT